MKIIEAANESPRWDWYGSHCNRCGNWMGMCRIDGCWPAGDGNYYCRLCFDCWRRLNRPEEWEAERLTYVQRHSE